MEIAALSMLHSAVLYLEDQVHPEIQQDLCDAMCIIMESIERLEIDLGYEE